VGEKANEKGKSKKGQTRIRVVLLCWMKKTQQSRKLKDRQLYSLGTRIVEERRTGEGKVEEGVGIALLSCLECSTVFFSLLSNDVIYFSMRFCFWRQKNKKTKKKQFAFLFLSFLPPSSSSQGISYLAPEQQSSACSWEF